MPMNKYPVSLQAESLMAHMRAICNGIGSRPSASEQERQAADYVEKIVRQSGVTNIERQVFKSHNSPGWIQIPCFLAGLFAVIFVIAGGQWGKFVGSALFLSSAFVFYRFLFATPPFFSKLISHWTSQNVIAKIPAENQARQTIYIVGHLDSQKQRFQFPPSLFWIMKAQTSLPVIAGVLGGVLALVDILFNHLTTPYWLVLGFAYLYGLLGSIYDETQPYVEGANDNATAVSLLLGMAQALKDQPLKTTAVVLLFTGSEEVGCAGMENYLKQYSPPKEDTLWVDIEMVGTGNLCYITRHGVSYLSTYLPHSEMVAFAEQTARKNPHLNVMGRNMVIIEEIANLRKRNYKAICIAGYSAEGVLPNWHRLSDNLSNIEPDTLSRAASYIWELIQEIDLADENVH